MNNYNRDIKVLEEKVILLLNKLKENYLKIDQLSKQVEHLKTIEQNLKTKFIDLDNQNKSLIVANNLLGSNEGKKITKRKIDKLINEIETCINQFSEIKNE
tara:strand:- start:923 stop:1225 length:303 start_codon:yes stop_codon:yes gene_type:complete